MASALAELVESAYYHLGGLMRRTIAQSLFLAAGIAVACIAAPAVAASGALAAQTTALVSPYDNVVVTDTYISAYDEDGLSEEVITWVYAACKLLGGNFKLNYISVDWYISSWDVRVVKVPVNAECTGWRI